MERITKVFFDPLASTKEQVQHILTDLPVGSAHPFSPERILLLRTTGGIEEIDISAYPDEYFFNAIDLGEIGETLQRRMAGFSGYLRGLNDYTVQQAPASTFKVPIVPDEIALLTVSARTPTYFDFCMGDEASNTCCWAAPNTFPGMSHSGDITRDIDLLQHIRIDMNLSKDIAIVISGFQITKLSRFLGSNPVVMVPDHAAKILYIVPVPLDEATIGDATLCCPLVIRRVGNELICCILPAPTTDTGKMINHYRLDSPLFAEAIRRADFNMPFLRNDEIIEVEEKASKVALSTPESISQIQVKLKRNVVLASGTVALPSIVDLNITQIIRFASGIEFTSPDQDFGTESGPSTTAILPCIFGSKLEGPILLATGTAPSCVPFSDEYALRAYYEQLATVVFVVDNRMTDNARNLAGPYRINALFIVEASAENTLKDDKNVHPFLNSLNVNAVTALAGPQSLILVHISGRFLFYRGIANQKYLNTTNLGFGSDVTKIIESVGVENILDPRVKRLVKLGEANTVLLPTSGRIVQPQDLQKIFDELSIPEIHGLKDDISAAVPQLQCLLNQQDLIDLSQKLTSTLSTKVNDGTASMRNTYVEFLTKEYKATDPMLTKKKASMLGELRKHTLDLQKDLESVISALTNMMSSQTTSKRTHDLKKLLRQTAIKANVAATQNMTYDTLAGYLETYAGEMGVMLLNIETAPYYQLLGNLTIDAIDASSCCDLDSRVLHLEGFDAGIIIPQSQSGHAGPLSSQLGSTHPILALPYLSQGRGSGSMLAWVCWDEFVNLENPFSVRWIEKCNEAHIASLRIIMRATLSKAVASRAYNLEPAGKETGQLMSALLMAAMSKLATMRTTAPKVTEKAEDTITKLMRGLFGNLLTIAGSGVRPLSMCWQLLGNESQSDLPSTHVEWRWYETVVSLYPYTGWPLPQFQTNLKKLLDKLIIRVVTKNEKTDDIKKNRAEELAKFCYLRNIQLEQSRTIITIFMRMLTQENGFERKEIASRLLTRLPHTLEKQSKSYGKMIEYLKHLAISGERRPYDDLVLVSVYTKRAAAFGELKSQIAAACKENEYTLIKELCSELVDKHAAIAALWQVKPEVLKLQNFNAYQGLLDADFADAADDLTKGHNKSLMKKVSSDAERIRRPWQLTSRGGKRVDDDIEPLDELFIREILDGVKIPASATTTPNLPSAPAIDTVAKKDDPEGFVQFSLTLESQFIADMDKALSPEDVCRILGIPVSTMSAFVKMLNPAFVWNDLGGNFKEVVMALVKSRSEREATCPVHQLLDLGGRMLVSAEGEM